jgi:hypothetical protein
MSTLEGLQTEIACWRAKLEAMHARQVGSPIDLAIRKLQTREINERIRELTAKLTNIEAKPKKRPRRKHARAFSERTSTL